MIPFDVISKRSSKKRTVYAVSLHEAPYFLIYRGGKWVWEESVWYKPTSDTAEGRWKGAGMGDYRCSICDETVSGNSYKYCPYCGARMEVRNNGKT